MTDYEKFLEGKQKSIILSGFDVDENDLNKSMFDFQKFIVKRAMVSNEPIDYLPF